MSVQCLFTIYIDCLTFMSNIRLLPFVISWKHFASSSCYIFIQLFRFYDNTKWTKHRSSYITTWYLVHIDVFMSFMIIIPYDADYRSSCCEWNISASERTFKLYIFQNQGKSLLHHSHFKIKTKIISQIKGGDCYKTYISNQGGGGVTH